MEQQEPRRDFVTDFYAFCEEVELNKDFMDELKKLLDTKDKDIIEKDKAKTYMKQVLKFGETAELEESVLELLKRNGIDEDIKDAIQTNRDMARKAFIFLEFTRERSTCDEMVNILRKCGQHHAANKLKGYNTSPPFMLLSYQIELSITPAKDLRSGYSKWFKMERKPRGMFIIINNIKSDFEKESLRFKNIGEQLGFVVEHFYDMNTTVMKNKLIELSKDKRLTEGDALVVMTISHGHDEKVYGADGSDIRITQIIDIFLNILKNKPKLFFFNCCRIQDKITATVKENPDQDEIVMVLKNPSLKWKNDHQKTMVCFACAEGYPAFYDKLGFTYFGQSLSHCIAQYACNKSVQSIMTLTAQRCKQFGSLIVDEIDYGYIRPETRFFDLDRELYFNPGLYKEHGSDEVLHFATGRNVNTDQALNAI